MRSNKREFIGLTALCAMVLAFTLAWGPSLTGSVAFAQSQPQQAQPQPQQQPDQATPQPQTPPDQATPQPQHQPDSTQATATSTFTGTVVKNGDQYMLRDSSGQIFGLDDSSKAQQFEGKSVKVTGQLDQQAKVIHVENIEAAEA